MAERDTTTAGATTVDPFTGIGGLQLVLSGPAAGALLSVVSIEDLMARWRWERTKTYEVVASPGFPAPIGDGRDRRWLLLAVLRWELARATRRTPASTVAPAAGGPPPRPPGRPRRGGA